MSCQQQQGNYYSSERPLIPPPSIESREESCRPSWNCVMDIDNELQYACTLPSLKKKPRRSVSFNPNSTLYSYNVPEDDPQDWYTDADEVVMKADARKEVDIFRMMKGGLAAAGLSRHHQRNLCIVGLEQQLVSPEFTKKRARTKKLVKYAVLVEQAKMNTAYGNTTVKAERIAAAARRNSEWSAAQAKMIGDFQHIQSKESR